MCLPGCSRSSPPASTSPAAPVMVACGSASSEVQVIDEIGLPFANQAVTVTLPDSRTANGSTLADGRICLSVPPGSNVRVALAETHEAGPGDSTTTPSGHHFTTNGTGP